MKNVFAYNSKSENEEFDGASLSIRKINEDTNQEIKNYQEEISKLEEKSAPSRISEWIKLIAYFVILILAVFILKSFMNNEFLVAIKSIRNIIFFAVIIISSIVMLIFKIKDKKKMDKVAESDEVKKINEKGELIYKRYNEELRIPDDTVDIDILSNSYEIVGGEAKPISNICDYVALAVTAFKEENNLCFALDGVVYAADIDSIKVVKHNKRIKTIGWNKEEKYNKGEYSKYHIRTDQMGVFHFKFYYSLEFKNDLTDYQIIIPVYDIDKLLSILDKDIIDNNTI